MQGESILAAREPSVSGRVVCDSSALAPLLLDSGSDGQWATARLRDADLSAPTLVAFEAANIIRRHELAGLISPDQARQAHADLLDLPTRRRATPTRHLATCRTAGQATRR